MKRTSTLLVVAAAACGHNTSEGPQPPGGCPTSGAPDVVATDQGDVRGTAAGDVVAYLGIPYAKPPVGALRFAPPERFECFAGTYDAAAFGAACPQVEVDDAGQVTAYRGDEDCLTLNVWAPAGAGPRPVLFFIHGGGNVQGSSGETAVDGSHVYDGATLAANEDVVVVTVSYRLGHLGFLVHDELASESALGTSGNYGLLDQVAALAWVQRNVAAFGGDPARVLVFGESAGAVDTCAMVATPLAAGSFGTALMESGSCTARSVSDLSPLADDLLAATDCNSATNPIACLRALDAETLVTALPAVADVVGVGQVSPGPVFGGAVLPEHPLELLVAGKHNQVPLVIGVNSEETGRMIGAIADEAAFDAALLLYAGGNHTLADLAKAQYPVADYGGSWRKAFVALTSDAKFVCTARRSARAADAGQDEPVYRYWFTHALDANPTLAALGAWHGLELAFVFDHLEVGAYTPSDAERDLALAIGGYWARLATGDPNGDGAPSWPTMNGDEDRYLRLDDPIAAEAGIREVQCEFWDSLL